MDDETTTTKPYFLTIFLTGLVSLAVGVGSSLLVNQLTGKRAKLTYDITTREVFPGQQQKIGIFALRISNDGKQEIEQLLCHVQFSEGEVTERSVAGIPESARTVAGSAREIDVTVPFLNPGEQFSVHVLLANVSSPLRKPSIDVRGKGVLGSPAQPETRSRKNFLQPFAVALSVLAALSTWFMLLSRGRTALSTLVDMLNPSSHSGDQRDTIAFVLETKGLLEEAKDLRQSPRKLTYWAVSDALCARWLQTRRYNRKLWIVTG